jgi:SAM-dependent methyltransferase
VKAVVERDDVLTQRPGLVATLEALAAEYPPEMREEQRRDVPRIAFNIEATIAAAPRKPLGELSVCDVGGGIGLFSAGCAAIGFGRVLLIDDFRDEVNVRLGESTLDLHRRLGVAVHSCDVIEDGLQGAAAKFDVVTTFDSMEHWHHSPKRLFHEIVDGLADGGGLLIGAPNCVNLRKRLSVPLGRGAWSSMQDWYEPERFRGHVREPSVADLRFIARDLRLGDVRVFGRNWLGLGSGSPLVHTATRLLDGPLRLFPGLCSNLYLAGRKRGG